MTLVLNNSELAVSASEPLVLMDVHAFIAQFGYDVDKLYIDRFWNSLDDESWIVVDYDMLRWMGYDCARDDNNKTKYRKMLDDNFIAGEDYDFVSGDDIRVPYLKVGNIKLAKNTIIVSSDTFKESLMMLRTKKAGTIRGYYKTLEKIFRDYERYTRFVSDHNHAVEIRQLTDLADPPPTFDLDTSLVRFHEYCYVMTSKRYYRKSMFKIGKSINPRVRLITHNCTQATAEDEMFYTHVISTSDGLGLEKMLHKALDRYHTTKEWFTVPHKHLRDIIQLVIAQQATLLQRINAVIKTDTSEALTLEEFTGMSVDHAEPAMNALIEDTPVAVVVGADADRCGICDTRMMDDPQTKHLTCPVCSDIPNTTVILFKNNSRPSFNSKHAGVLSMVRDEQYCSWLLSQRWFWQKPEYELIRRLYTPKAPIYRRRYRITV